MQSRFLNLIFLTGVICLASWLITPSALAMTPIRLYNLTYTECPAEFAEGIVGSGDISPANCFLVVGKAENKSGKPVVDADVFGRIYDANDNPVMENRGRLGTIAEVPPGVSDFSIRISVSAEQPTPLKLKQFKASGFAGAVRPYYYQTDEEE